MRPPAARVLAALVGLTLGASILLVALFASVVLTALGVALAAMGGADRSGGTADGEPADDPEPEPAAA